MNKTDIYRIAAETGIDPRTVKKALKDPEHVRPIYRDRVHEVAKKLGLSPEIEE